MHRLALLFLAFPDRNDRFPYTFIYFIQQVKSLPLQKPERIPPRIGHYRVYPPPPSRCLDASVSHKVKPHIISLQDAPVR